MLAALAACQFFTVKKNTVNFYDGDALVKTVSVRDADNVRAPSQVEKSGYTFVKWVDRRGVEFSADYVLSEKNDFYAVWEPATYNITYVLNGGENNARNPTTYTLEDEFTIFDATRVGYRFYGWTTEDDPSPVKMPKIEKGTIGDLTFTAVFETPKYTLTFNTMGGSTIDPVTVEMGAAITEPETPTKRNCEFTGWYKDADCTEAFEFTVMPDENITIYAGWYSDDYFVLSYSSTEGAEIEASEPSGSNVLAGEEVHLIAPTFSDGLMFNYWTDDGGSKTYENELRFDMPKDDINLFAVYSPIRTLSFDASNDEDLTFIVDAPVVRMDGAKMISANYTVETVGEKSSVTVKASFLTKLKEGYYPFAILVGSGEDLSEEYLTIKVYHSAKTIFGVKIDYDLNYPAVTLVIDGAEGEKFQYSVDAYLFQDAERYTILEGYDKSTFHNVTVRNKNDKFEQFVVEKDGYTEENRGYIQSYYEYNGSKHDNYIEDEDEFYDLTDYLINVYAPLNRTKEGSEYAGGSATYEFYCGENFYNALNATPEITKQYFVKAFSGGVPYAPSYTYSVGTDRKARLSIHFKTDTPNEFISSQEESEVLTTQALLKPSSRAEDYDGFKINSYKKTQVIRTLYELEALPLGIKPVFKEKSGQAYETYQKALEVLRLYVDDDMNEFEKLSVFYDYLALTVTYDDVCANDFTSKDIGKYTAFTSYGALVQKIAVCDGIASAFSLLCKIEGIECTEVAGLGKGAGHAWNKVNVGGLWYAVDATWCHLTTDEGIYVYHKNFLNDEGFSSYFGHDENGSLGEDEKFVDNAAISPLNYYSYEVNGSDRIAESKEEFVEILRSAKDSGAEAVELKIVGFEIQDAADYAAEVFTTTISYYTITDDSFVVVVKEE